MRIGLIAVLALSAPTWSVLGDVFPPCPLTDQANHRMRNRIFVRDFFAVESTCVQSPYFHYVGFRDLRRSYATSFASSLEKNLGKSFAVAHPSLFGGVLNISVSGPSPQVIGVP